jgi:hypothetical protein
MSVLVSGAETGQQLEKSVLRIVPRDRGPAAAYARQPKRLEPARYGHPDNR